MSLSLTLQPLKCGIGRFPVAKEISRNLENKQWDEMIRLEGKLLDLFPAIYKNEHGKSLPPVNIEKGWIEIAESDLSYHRNATSYSSFLINTLVMKPEKPKKDDEIIVLLHGYASGIAKWTPLLANLVDKQVYCFDWLGWGLSSRPDFRTLMTDHESPEQTMGIWVRSLDVWLKALKLTDKRITLVGHSMGSYLGLAFLGHFGRNCCVERMVCLSPVGLVKPSLPLSPQNRSKNAFVPVSQLPTNILSWGSSKDLGLGQTLVLQLLWTNTPQRILQLMSPQQAKMLLKRVRSQENVPSKGKIKQHHIGYPGCLGSEEQELSIDYTYSAAVLGLSGDLAFRNLAQWQDNRVVWAKPLESWLLDTSTGIKDDENFKIRSDSFKNIPIDFVYGEFDWTDMRFAWENLSKRSNYRLWSIRNVGHHLYSVSPKQVASVILASSSSTPPGNLFMDQDIVSRWKESHEKAIKSEDTTKSLKNTFLSWFA